jgi:hypothetical protein
LELPIDIKRPSVTTGDFPVDSYLVAVNSRVLPFNLAMKILAVILVAVIAMHSQCMVSCLASHKGHTTGPDSNSAPPCHESQHPKAPSGNHSANDDSGCGFGVVVESKIRVNIEAGAPLTALPSFVASLSVVEQSRTANFFTPVVLDSSLGHSPALNLTLRI